MAEKINFGFKSFVIFCPGRHYAVQHYLLSSTEVFQSAFVLADSSLLPISETQLENDTLTFSYTPKKSSSVKRGKRFFEAIVMGKALWFEQADIALSEYFDILLRVVKQSEESETSKVMLEYCGVWKAISNLK